MSDRSAKLLLEVAKMIEAKVIQEPHAFRKMGGGCDSVPFRAGLVAEVQKWADGYQKHIDTVAILKKKEASQVSGEMRVLAAVLFSISAALDTMRDKEVLGFDEVRTIAHALNMCHRYIKCRIGEGSNG